MQSGDDLVFRCPYQACPNRYPTSEELVNHMLSDHGRHTSSCSFLGCPLRFVSDRDRQTHLRDYHGIAPAQARRRQPARNRQQRQPRAPAPFVNGNRNGNHGYNPVENRQYNPFPALSTFPSYVGNYGPQYLPNNPYYNLNHTTRPYGYGIYNDNTYNNAPTSHPRPVVRPAQYTLHNQVRPPPPEQRRHPRSHEGHGNAHATLIKPHAPVGPVPDFFIAPPSPTPLKDCTVAGCTAKFSSIRSEEVHMWSHATPELEVQDSSEPIRNQVCPFCPERFYDLEQVGAHIIDVHEADLGRWEI